MASRLREIFEDQELMKKIQRRLPYLFQLAESENARACKPGMEVGSARERVLVALLIYKFGEENVTTDLPITEKEVDVALFGKPISIKTITGKSLSGVKLIWTVDANKAREFQDKYYPGCDILLAQITWGNTGGLYYLPLETQVRVFEAIGREKYIKLPKPGTNPRGVEITREALLRLTKDPESKKIPIFWQRQAISFNPYQKWVDLWREE